VVVFSFFIIDIGLQAIEVSIFFLVFSVAVYYLYGRKHSFRSYALVYLLRRLIDRHLDHDNLEDELLDVLLHRDEVKLNIFQELAQKSTILDLPYPMTFDNMLKVGSAALASETGLAPELLEESFLQRQAEGTTAFSPFLAIPHFITPDEHDLFIQIIRCKNGIFFDEEHPRVQAIFLLGGGRKKRREHLQCLAAIATMAEELPDFKRQWLEASNISELRNLILQSGKSKGPGGSED
ncbi:MAG: PTS sugar transporter subunit IIA, partial [Spirochaetota bacterium]